MLVSEPVSQKVRALATLIERFINRECREQPGSTIVFDEFYRKFCLSLPESQRYSFSRRAVAKALPSDVLYGPWHCNARHIGNFKWNDCESPKIGSPFILVNGVLRRQL
jgi:hypothetical protein